MLPMLFSRMKKPLGFKKKQMINRDISPLLFGALTGVLFLAIVVTGLIMEFQLHLRESDLKAHQVLSSTRAKLENELNSRLTLSQGLVSYVKLNSELSGQQFDHYVKYLIGNDPMIRNISLLKGTTIIYAYPYETNKAAIGTDLMAIPAQQDSLKRAIESRKPVITGIVNLVQGGRGIIFRIPIYLEDEDTPQKTDSFWGLASIVLNADELFKVIGIEEVHRGYRIGLRSLDEHAVNNGIIYGDETVFQNQSLAQEILLSSGKWQMVAAKEKGTALIDFRMAAFLIAGIILTLFCSVFVGYMAHLRNIMKNMAITDTLTKLPNRALLADNFQLNMNQALQNSTKFGILMLDIDKFKAINDTYGHTVGDGLLKAFSERLKSQLRASDTVIRMGGDEFLLLIAGAKNMEDIQRIVDKIRLTLAGPFVIEGSEIPAGSSIGYSIFPDDGEDMDLLITKADNAMYEEKKSKAVK